MVLAGEAIKSSKINLLLKIQNSNNSGTKHNFSKKFSAHLPGQNGDLGLYFRPVSLISPKSAKKLGKLTKIDKKSEKNLLERRLVETQVCAFNKIILRFKDQVLKALTAVLWKAGPQFKRPQRSLSKAPWPVLGREPPALSVSPRPPPDLV